ncbi:secreted RxLR effector protein 161-like [Arachis hypogaea]|uniref:secreted RxLR effector protein 161-like n=1 Tax=Arachis hypogaea TaxID=3818 RepID=UPI000DEC2CA9|nr:uncharacterized protein LOC112803460 [Arachis hypogaea]
MGNGSRENTGTREMGMGQLSPTAEIGAKMGTNSGAGTEKSDEAITLYLLSQRPWWDELFLGIEVVRDHDAEIHLSQTKYVTDLFYKAGMPNAKPMPTPLTSSLKFSAHGGEPFSKPALYRSLVGGLRYATITRPEISYAVNKVSQFMHCPLETHWKAVKQILRYLARTVHHDLRFQKSKDCRLYGFCDSDWGSDVDDRKSTSEFCVYLGLNLVSWSNRKQPVVFKSSTEAEYRSLAAGLTEII